MRVEEVLAILGVSTVLVEVQLVKVLVFGVGSSRKTSVILLI